MDRDRRNPQGSVGRRNITIRICHPQNDHEETRRRICVKDPETRARAPIAKVPTEIVWWSPAGSNGCPSDKFTRTYVSTVPITTVTDAPNGWSRDRNYVDRSRQDPHRVTHNSYSIRSTIKCDQGHSVVSGHYKGMADETLKGPLVVATNPPASITRTATMKTPGEEYV